MPPHPAQAARRLRHTARAKHTRHHARNLNRDGPGVNICIKSARNDANTERNEDRDTLPVSNQLAPMRF